MGRPARVLFGTPSQVRGVNLIAARPSGRPTVRPSIWLVAHYDSKGQPISMAIRLIGFAALVLGLITVFFLKLRAIMLLAVAAVIASQYRVKGNLPCAASDHTPRDARINKS